MTYCASFAVPGDLRNLITPTGKWSVDLGRKYTPKRLIFQAMRFWNRYPEQVTDEIRQIIRQHIAESGLSQAEVARRLGVQPQVLNRALQERGMVTPIWQRILEYFGLKIVVIKKDAP